MKCESAHESRLDKPIHAEHWTQCEDKYVLRESSPKSNDKMKVNKCTRYIEKKIAT
jgi:hypothetical protein